MTKRPDVLDPDYIEAHFGDLLIEALQEALAYERGEPDAPVRVVVRTTDEPAVSPPPAYTSGEITQLRARLGVSRDVFAAMLNVRRGTLVAWEQGKRHPAGPALRLLQWVAAAPEQFGAYLAGQAHLDRAG